MADDTTSSAAAAWVPALTADTPAVLKLRIVSSGDGEGELNLESSRAVLVLCEPSEEEILVRGPRIVLRVPGGAGSDQFGL